MRTSPWSRHGACAAVLGTSLACVVGASACDEARPAVADSLWAHDNLVAWTVVPFDAKNRGPEERAQMLQDLGFKRFAYDWRPVHVPSFDAEIEALQRHGIELLAWWFPLDAGDPVARATLETFKRHGVRPRLWVTQSGGTLPDEQADRVKQEADRILALVRLAAPYGVKIALYNHNGWFGVMDNQVAIIERLAALGVTTSASRTTSVTRATRCTTTPRTSRTSGRRSNPTSSPSMSLARIRKTAPPSSPARVSAISR
jgi:hypothetical protein